MPGSCRSCVCGHVFAEIKQVGGKRFSGYRVELYTRLERKRMKTLTKPKQRRMVELGSSDEENFTANKLLENKPKKPKARFFADKVVKKPKRRKHKRVQLTRPQLPSQLRTQAQQEQSRVPTEIIERLPIALAEINRKLFGQNLIWARL